MKHRNKETCLVLVLINFSLFLGFYFLRYKFHNLIVYSFNETNKKPNTNETNLHVENLRLDKFSYCTCKRYPVAIYCNLFWEIFRIEKWRERQKSAETQPLALKIVLSEQANDPSIHTRSEAVQMHQRRIRAAELLAEISWIGETRRGKRYVKEHIVVSSIFFTSAFEEAVIMDRSIIEQPSDLCN